MFGRMISGAIGAILLATAVQAVPVQISYGSIVATTTEDFTGELQPSGTSADFDGFTFTVPDELRIQTSSFVCGSAADTCAFNLAIGGDRVIDGLAPGTTQLGLDLYKLAIADIIRVTVAGNSGVSVFNLASGGFFGFQDASGLLSVTLQNLGPDGIPGPAFSFYSMDDVITNGAAAPIPLPAGLPLLAVGLLGFGIVGRKTRRG